MNKWWTRPGDVTKKFFFNWNHIARLSEELNGVFSKDWVLGVGLGCTLPHLLFSPLLLWRGPWFRPRWFLFIVKFGVWLKLISIDLCLSKDLVILLNKFYVDDTKYFSRKPWVTYRFSYAKLHNDARRMGGYC